MKGWGRQNGVNESTPPRKGRKEQPPLVTAPRLDSWGSDRERQDSPTQIPCLGRLGGSPKEQLRGVCWEGAVVKEQTPILM